MIDKIIKIGRVGTVAIITAFSIVFSAAIVAISFRLYGRELDSFIIAISILTPAIVAPSITWIIVGFIVKIHELETEMRSLATYDMLTGVMTRRAFLENSESLYQVALRSKSPLSIAYIDIDDFKAINDTNGHAGGDEILKAFGSIMQTHKRKNDLAGRIGGEEFALTLPNTDIEGATQLSKVLWKSAKEARIDYSKDSLQYTLSIGIAQLDTNNPVDLEKLISQADKALYRAKEQGKNRIVKFSIDD